MKISNHQQIYESVSVLDSDDLVDNACEGLLAIMELVPERKIIGYQVGGGNGVRYEHFNAIKNGIYMPGSKRCYWVGRFDVEVDDLPEIGCVYIKPSKGEFYAYATVRKIKKFPKRVFCQCRKAKAYYEVITTRLLMFDVERDKTADRGKTLIVELSYFAIGEDGSVWLAIDVNKKRSWQNYNDLHDGHHIGPGALSLLADKKYLWLVETSENCINDRYSAKMCFGVEEEYIKSLVFARDAPLTETGRKRPILHWVASHKRRIEKGVDVDVRKHLRGISSFPLAGLDFKITQPYKGVKEIAA